MSNQGASPPGSEWAHMFVACGALVVLYLIYNYFHDAINAFVLQVKLFELYFAGLFSASAHAYYMAYQHANSSAMGFTQVLNLSEITSNYLVWPLAGLVLMGALIVYYRHPDRRFITVFSMARLLGWVNHLFPVTSPVVKVDPQLKKHLNDLTSNALTPQAFMDKYQLITENEDKKVIDRSRVERLLVDQLGDSYRCTEKFLTVDIFDLPLYKKVLLALCTSYILSKRKEADQLLDEINKNYQYLGEKNHSSMGEIETQVDQMIRLNIKQDFICYILKKHAFISTLLAALLDKGREGGIIACASFLWLKKIDRDLWYGLNNMGRKAVFIEGVAIVAHYQVESKIDHALRRPNFENIFSAMNLILQGD